MSYVKNGGIKINPLTSDLIKKDDKIKITSKLLGIFPLKDINVEFVTKKDVYVCGNTVGIKINTNGILVVGSSGVLINNNTEAYPYKNTGIQAGDFIVSINGKKIYKTSQLIDEIQNSEGKEISIAYLHNDIINETNIKPIKAADDGYYHIGLWVRDSTAGIGTITFYDPSTQYFGALGHGITDIDTGTIMSISKGEVLKSSINGIKKGTQGNPGE